LILLNRRDNPALESTKEAQAVTGHASSSDVERYTKAAEQEKLARQAVAKLIKNG